MHYSHCVALPGSAPPGKLNGALEAQMDRYFYDNDECVSGEWDWYVVGGRWGGSWVLRPDGEAGPLASEAHSMGKVTHDDGRIHTDCARRGEIEPESLGAPYSYLDLGGVWHTKWLGPEGSGSQEVATWEVDTAQWTAQWLEWLQSLPQDTWLVQVDIHN